MSRSCVLTATAPDRRRRGAPPIWRCRILWPGKSLRFALLPEGQDPDDLARAGGRAAIEDVISASRGLVDMIWSREIEGGNFATPERRAALEKRVGEIANAIRDEVVRRYYRQDLASVCSGCSRLRSRAVLRWWTPRQREQRRKLWRGYSESARRFAPRDAPSRGRFDGRGGRPQGPGASLPRGPYQAASSQLAASPIVRGQRSAMSRREALILQCLINHPWILHDHLEEVAALDLAHREAHKLRAGIIAAFANDHHQSPEHRRANRKDAGRSGSGRIFASTSKG